MGLLMLQLLRNAGAAAVVVSEPLQPRRAQAARLQADRVLDPAGDDVVAEIHAVAPDGVHLAVDYSGNPRAAAMGLDLLRRGGTLLLMGLGSPTGSLPILPNDIVDRELTIAGAVLNPFSFQRSIELLGAGRVQVRELVTPFSLGQVVEAIQATQQGSTIKSMVVNSA